MNKLPLINIRWTGSEYRVDIPNWNGGAVYLAEPVEARIVDLQAQIEALKAESENWRISAAHLTAACNDIHADLETARAEIARYESGRCAMVAEIEGLRKRFSLPPEAPGPDPDPLF